MGERGHSAYLMRRGADVVAIIADNVLYVPDGDRLIAFEKWTADWAGREIRV